MSLAGRENPQLPGSESEIIEPMCQMKQSGEQRPVVIFTGWVVNAVTRITFLMLLVAAITDYVSK
ncbi:hypothetical protein VQ7734_00104 [Vibrio quintilis]|uniref:Uncharacterized protein n=1 Tax=Vibrio quintilis TaxID=1117707 RepID=A0A1M7YP30_9VIBR|nr:hypothetical protein VQ7734_00104 [Vibrio quintilis]